MKVPEKILDEFKPADGRGRVTLGSEFADKRVKLAVLEVEDPDVE